MMYLGFVLLVVGVVAAVFGLLQKMKQKAILAAPFKGTGEIAANPGVADEKGHISTQGTIEAGQPLTAPCSGKQCVYYEIKSERLWEKTVQTEDGTKKKTGTTNLESFERGMVFGLNDGSGPVQINAIEKVDAELDRSFREKKSVSSGDVYFGEHRVNVPYSHGDEYTTGVRTTEKLVPCEGNLFVLGKLENGTITKKDGMMGKLLLSKKDRDGLLGATKRNMIIGWAAGGVLVIAGTLMAIFGEAPTSSCDGMQDVTAETCTSRIYNESGSTLTWTVATAGTYTFSVMGTGTSTTNRLWPKLTVKNAAGEVVHSDEQTGGEALKTSAAFEPGTYTLHINDGAVSDWAEQMEGGIGFSLDITSDGAAALPAGDVEEPAALTPPEPGSPGAAQIYLKAAFLTPGADTKNLTRALQPQLPDYKKIFAKPKLAKKANKKLKKAWNAGEVVIAAGEGQTEVLIYAATAEELKSGTGNATKFGGNWTGVADKLKPGTVLYRFEFAKPGQASGTGYDGLYYSAPRWVLIHEPWNAF